VDAHGRPVKLHFENADRLQMRQRVAGPTGMFMAMKTPRSALMLQADYSYNFDYKSSRRHEGRLCKLLNLSYLST
jgi:hypothetical protein